MVNMSGNTLLEASFSIEEGARGVVCPGRRTVSLGEVSVVGYNKTTILTAKLPIIMSALVLISASVCTFVFMSVSHVVAATQGPGNMLSIVKC